MLAAWGLWCAAAAPRRGGAAVRTGSAPAPLRARTSWGKYCEGGWAAWGPCVSTSTAPPFAVGLVLACLCIFTGPTLHVVMGVAAATAATLARLRCAAGSICGSALSAGGHALAAGAAPPLGTRRPPTQCCALPAPPLWLCVLALVMSGACAACPGAAAPGYFCAGSLESPPPPCQGGSFCTGGSAPATPCMPPANCAGVGLSAEPPSPRHLAFTSTIPSFGGSISTTETFHYCTSAAGSTCYRGNAYQASLRTAPSGYRIVLATTQWSTEPGYDYGTIFLTNNSGDTPTATSACALSGVTRGGIGPFAGGTPGAYAGTPAGSPVSSPFGGGAGLCFRSDSIIANEGMGCSITAEACPRGLSAPTMRLPCAAVRSAIPSSAHTLSRREHPAHLFLHTHFVFCITRSCYSYHSSSPGGPVAIAKYGLGYQPCTFRMPFVGA